MKVLVSACIMGENCKYNGKNNKNSAAIHFLKDKEVISICPEVLAGMETPRPCAEIVNGRVVDENGNDVSLEYNKAVAVALSKIQNEEIDLVILQSRSPTCGVNQIYDGSFTGKLVSGMGLFAKALKQKGYHVIDVEVIVLAMCAVGLNTNIVKLIKTGGKPLALGFCCWVGIASMSLLMQHVLGIW